MGEKTTNVTETEIATTKKVVKIKITTTNVAETEIATTNRNRY